MFGDTDPRLGYSRVFFALQRINRTMMPGVDRALKAEGIADPIWYEILLAASEAGAAGVQMIALQRRLFLPQYALSRHISRMEKAGLICRQSQPGAGRGQIIHLTENAQGLHERVWLVYRAEIEAHLAERLSTAEAYQALKLLNRLYP
ncbi:MAG: MarR family transcriptional regulator [Cypionkella sp.]|uniref:MarR family winged helix-turn-helix transcriptional regulator n=1 Tax=Cypionkella sp. TaxID=2811411 RepID=UPI002ABB7763|nr:MarR family transcriptional regulator [Cypionkella sp.]MDZ4309485.1 MarR family transcriptional regulator [Cypionkella sp.]